MRLALTESGQGHRTALLVHGIMSDARAWHRVAAELERRGFRVLAVDLAGHGQSPRARRYAPASWADDVVETIAPVLPEGIDLVVGHSLGALVASLAAERLGARALVYLDPAFAFPRGVLGVAYKLVFGLAPRPRRWLLRRANPKWDAVDLDIELAGLRDWHRRTLWAFVDTSPLAPPERVVAPSLVLRAERSMLITRRVEARLRERGMTVETIPGTGHTLFRDELALVLAALDRWRERVTAVG